MGSKLSLVIVMCLFVANASAQVPTGTISGRVMDEKGGTAPGVTVTATSPNLQGPRVTVTSMNGDYTIPLLPPGEYSVAFELSGFRTIRRSVSVSSTQTKTRDPD